MNEIATFIKCLMEETNMSQAELSRKISLSRSTLSKILRGKTDGSLKALNEILGVFDCYVTVRRKRNQTSDYDPESGKLRLPFDDPLDNNPAINKLRDKKDKTKRPL